MAKKKIEPASKSKKKDFKISSKNKQLLKKEGVTIADIEKQAKDNQPATITTGTGKNKRVTEVADTEDVLQEFKSDEDRATYMKELAEKKKYFVDVKQRGRRSRLLTLGFSLPKKKPKKEKQPYDSAEAKQEKKKLGLPVGKKKADTKPDPKKSDKKTELKQKLDSDIKKDHGHKKIGKLSIGKLFTRKKRDTKTKKQEPEIKKPTKQPARKSKKKRTPRRMRLLGYFRRKPKQPKPKVIKSTTKDRLQGVSKKASISEIAKQKEAENPKGHGKSTDKTSDRQALKRARARIKKLQDKPHHIRNAIIILAGVAFGVAGAIIYLQA
ncbi:MAG: hypothetical protein AAF413_01655 [Patescibacteria group bacterium]